jgi:hypothetical protein
MRTSYNDSRRRSRFGRFFRSKSAKARSATKRAAAVAKHVTPGVLQLVKIRKRRKETEERKRANTFSKQAQELYNKEND